MFGVGDPETIKINRSVKIILLSIIVIVVVYVLYSKATSKSTILIPAEDAPEDSPEVTPEPTTPEPPPQTQPQTPPPQTPPPQTPPPQTPPPQIPPPQIPLPPPSLPAPEPEKWNGPVMPSYVDHYDDRNFFHDWIDNYKTGPFIDKWKPYFRTYDRHFARYRNMSVVFVEIGVQSGGSTMLWPDYFGPGLKYYGMDINRNCEQFERKDPEKGIFVQIDYADQNSMESLESTKTKIKDVPDIILDDGGHTMIQQINTFKVFWPWLRKGGVYCCEDTHTSYMGSHSGKYKDPSTFIE